MDTISKAYGNYQSKQFFGAVYGENFRNLAVKDGKIVVLQWGNEEESGGLSSPELETKHQEFCLSTIDFIKMHNPQDFYNMRETLSDGIMKSHCLDILA